MTAQPMRPLLVRLRRDRRGTAIVETAIVLPVIMLLLFGLMEAGRALQQQHTLAKTVRDAARYLARVSLACPANTDPNWAAARSTAQHLAMTGKLSGGTALVKGWTEASFTVADPTCSNWSGRPVQLITVSANVPYQDLGLLGYLGLGPMRLGASHQQVHIGE
ncbi:TadE/TadG family type IV pilus assembly protein [Azospirillum sp. sgz301742]